MYRERACTDGGGCGPWSAPVKAKTVFQTGLYALRDIGLEAPSAGSIENQGRAELALHGAEVELHLVDDGALFPDESHVRHRLTGGAIAAFAPYGATRSYGDEVAVENALVTAGGVRDGVAQEQDVYFSLAGEVREGCARLVASPGMRIPGSAYRESEVGALLRY